MVGLEQDPSESRLASRLRLVFRVGIEDHHSALLAPYNLHLPRRQCHDEVAVESQCLLVTWDQRTTMAVLEFFQHGCA